MRLLTTFLVLLALSFPTWVGTADAQGKRRSKSSSAQKSKAKGKGSKGQPKEQKIVFDGLDLDGQMRTPQLLYFLDRANEELKRASLERRSFVREMVRSIDEENL